jgi:hypothetical protein
MQHREKRDSEFDGLRIVQTGILQLHSKQLQDAVGSASAGSWLESGA